jgi:hypothetical protein
MKSAIAAFAAVVAAAPAFANDTTAELTTGGLLFVHNDNVEMRSEDLSISTQRVDVRYRFFNTSEKDVTVLVAFPMPEVRVDGPDNMVAYPTEDPVNLLGFETTANGKPVKTEVEQRVTALGIDRTALLRSLGIPFAPQVRTTYDALDKLPRDKWNDLIRVGVAEIEEYDQGKGMEQHLAPRWALQTTFYWQQTFPAKAETVIEHHYQPSVGSAVETSVGDKQVAQERWYRDFVQKYCIDDAFAAAAQRAKKDVQDKFGVPLSEDRISYVLRTGANWSGPIKDFTLTIDKGAADSLVSFCGEDVKKIGATQFQMKKTDYFPEGDLSILFLHKLQQQ